MHITRSVTGDNSPSEKSSSFPDIRSRRRMISLRSSVRTFWLIAGSCRMGLQFNGALMPASDIVIKGAREHNLRSVDVDAAAQQADLPDRRQRVAAKARWRSTRCMPRGSGGTSKACPRSPGSFLGQMPKPEVDHISGLSPSISISQKSSGNNPRSTVGTITEIYDFLRVLYARVGQAIARSAAGRSRPRRASRSSPASWRCRPGRKFAVLAPLIRGQKGEYQRPVRGPAEAGLRAGPRRRPRSCRSPTTCRSTARCGTTSRW